MHVDVGLDSGDVILVETVPIAPGETGGSLHDKLAAAGPAALMRALELLASGDAPRTPQDHDAATHVGKLDRKDGALDWSRPAVEVERRVRAFDPWPGTGAEFPAGPVKVFPPVEVIGQAGAPGEVLAADADGIVIACGEGALRIKELQPSGKKRMTAAAYLSGRGLEVGSVLGAPT